MTSPTEFPLGDLALCLSGGGYRAAAYHLGMLRTLEELELLGQAKYFSTASGGAITAMKYVITRIEDKSFDVFYQETRRFLQQTNIVREAFSIMESVPSPSGSNDLSLIRAGAEIYRRKLTGMKTSKNQGDNPIKNGDSPDTPTEEYSAAKASTAEEWTIKDLRDETARGGRFHDLIFNSSEFRTGNNFRFRAVTGRNLVFGNRRTPVSEELYDRISLADVIASSSCFPGVFEPIRFPEDFQLTDWDRTRNPFDGDENQKLKSIALMDGGILDNQGLYGMTVSYRENPLPFSLMIVSDTTARSKELLKYDIEPRRGGISLKNILRLAVGFLLVLILCAGMLLTKVFMPSLMSSLSLFSSPLELWDKLLHGFVGSFLLLLSIAILGFIFWGKNKLKSLRVMGADFPIWSYLKNLSVRDVRTLLAGRLFSAEVMIFSVFMNRIRALQISYTESAIARNNRKNLFNGKTVFADIYEMSPLNDHKKEREIDPIMEPTAGMKQLSEKAENVGTKLWLNEEELKILIDCGRATVCFSLLKYAWKSERSKAMPEPDEEISPFYDLYEKWIELRKEFP